MKQENKIDLYEEIKQCKTIDDVMGKNGLVKRLTKDIIEKLLKAELDDHLGYSKHDPKGKNSGNSRNGYTEKTVRSSAGDLTLEIERDRLGTFEPKLIKKHQRDISEFDEKVISMYAKGMTTRDIQDHVMDIYGAEISPAQVSLITDKVGDLVHEWQDRPLDEVYVIVYFDAIFYKVRHNNKIENKAAYTCLGINTEGIKEVLGMWVGESEGARYWTTVLNELKNRGVRDIFIACVDGLKGFPEAIKSVFPATEIQLCVIHMIRNSLKFVGSKNQKLFLTDLKKVYQAPSEQSATFELELFCEKWENVYPLAVKPWITQWEHISTYFKYPPELRRMIYTTNAVESVHRQFRKVTKNRAVFPTDESLIKLLFLAIRDIHKKWTYAVRDWVDVVSQLHIFFGERFMIR